MHHDTLTGTSRAADAWESSQERTAGLARTVSVPGAELYTVTLGDGIPILMLHGGVGLDHTYFRPWLDPLAEIAAVTYFDQRDNGRSIATDPNEPFSFAALVSDINHLRRELGAERVVVVGHSYGGRVAQEYALAHPDRVAGLVLCATDACFNYPDVIVANAGARGTLEQVAVARGAFSGPLATDEELGAAFRTLLPLYFHHPEVLRQITSFDDIVYRVKAFNTGTFEGLPKFDARPRLHEITAPTLILGGIDDWVTPLEQGSRPLAEGIPGAELVVFEDSGHFPFIEEQERFLDVLGSWLGRLS